MCYEWGAADGNSESQLDVARHAAEAAAADGDAALGAGARAPIGMLDALFTWWEERLWASGFFGGARAVQSAYGVEEGARQEALRASAAMAKLRRMLMRSEPTKGEASLLRGALQSLEGRRESSDAD